MLITGSKGQLGSELVSAGSGYELLAVDCEQLDITDAREVDRMIVAFGPNAIINAAAYTAVDQAESESDKAFTVNCDGPKNLALAAEVAAIPLIHVSTDYVFDGSKQSAYVENDPLAPLGVYGISKLAGEQAVRQHCSRHLILRTSWVFSSHGHNFVKTILRLGAERESLSIVGDQYGCPTSAAELARAIYAVLDTGVSEETCGTYHFCQPEPSTWFGFAEAVFSEAAEQEMAMKVTNLNAITTADYPTPAKRPANSVMNCDKFSETFDFTIRPWSESLHSVIKELNHA